MPRPDLPAERAARRRPGTSRKGPGRLTAGALAVALATGVWLVHDGAAKTGPPQPPAAASDAGLGPAGADGATAKEPTPGARPSVEPERPVPAPLPPSAPARIRIPAIKVDAPVVGLGLDAARHLATPPMENRNLVGWYRDGATPGSSGAAIAVGHVDNRSGPTVFYRLGLLRKGDRVEVVRKDRRTAVFTIDSVQTYPKDRFPGGVVYGASERPELRIITCGGHYDKHSGYESNVVVFSHLTSTR
ncbi:class F sortase [Kitasatospora atroaurantiaca]|uniref:Sortase family protein n=1 Tax=Kitasatospora atroaurantiaca TaxID=285545 RepID=A0A561F0S9_9ACTN|nr:class F sortase [Kitasatospora atroaurantiaca]TWE21473.1 sortase family protein [Kitasatospora atroaurantiaca]